MESFLVLMENYSKAQKYSATASNSSGTAMKKMQTYEDSIEASTKKLTASFEKLATDTLDSSLVNGFVKVTTSVVDFVDKIGLLKPALGILAGIGAFKGIKYLGTSLASAGKSMLNFGSAISKVNELGNASKWSDLAQTFEGLSSSQTDTILKMQSLNKETKTFGDAMKAVSAVDDLSDTGALSRALVATKGLSAEQAASILTTKGLTVEQTALAISSAGLATEQEAMTVATATMSTAEGVATGATVGLAGGVTALGASLKALALSNPILTAIVVGFTAFQGISAIIDATTETVAEAEEKVKNAEQNYDKTNSQVTDIKSSLDKVNDKIKDINSHKLSFTDKKDITNLKEQQTLLESQLDIKEKILENDAKKKNDAAVNALNTKVDYTPLFIDPTQDPYHRSPKIINKLGIQQSGTKLEAVSSYTKDINTINKQISGQIKQRDSIGKKYGTESKQYKEINKDIADNIKIRDKAIEHGSKFADDIGEHTKDLSKSSPVLKESKDAIVGIDKAIKSSKVTQENAMDTTSKSTNKVQSLSEAWSQFAKSDSVEKLAYAGKLTVDSFQGFSGVNKLVTNTHMSVAELVDQIRAAVPLTQKLKNLSTSIKPVGSAFRDFKKNGFVSSTSLNGMSDSFKNLKGYSKFSEVAGNKKSSKSQVQGAFNDIVSEYINTNHILDNITSKTKRKIITALRDAGITNAKDLINQYTKVHNKNTELINSAEKNYEKYLKAKIDGNVNADKNISNISAQLMNALGGQYKIDVNNFEKAIDAKVKAWNSFAKGVMSSSIQVVDTMNAIENANANTKNSVISNSKRKKDSKKAVKSLINTASNPNDIRQLENLEKLKKNVDDTTKDANKKKAKIDADFKKVKVDFKADYSPSSTSDKKDKKKKEKKKKEKPSTQVIDWISRKLDVLQGKIDLTKSKFDNLFTVKSKDNNLKTQLKETQDLITANERATSKYQKVADNYANKVNKTKTKKGKKTVVKKSVNLPKNIRDKVKNGDYDIKDYSSSLADRIQKYQDYIDKVKNAKKAVQELKKQEKDLADQRNQLKIDEAESAISALDARENNATTASKKNDREKEKLKWIKQSYDYQIKLAEAEKNSAKIAQLRAEEENAILESKKKQVQNTLDENATKKTLLESKLNNAVSAKDKNKIISDEIGNAQSDNKAYRDTYNKAKTDLSNNKTSAKIAASMSDISSSDKKKIKSFIKSGKEIPQELLDKAMKLNNQTLYQKLLDYNANLDWVSTSLINKNQSDEDTKTAINTAYKSQFDNIAEEYSNKIGLRSSDNDTIQSVISSLQARGKNINTDFYQTMINQNSKTLPDLVEEKAKLEKSLKNLTVNKSDWYDAQSKLASVNQEIEKTTQSTAEWQKEINNIKLKKFDDINDKLSQINTESDFLIKMLSYGDLFDSKSGAITGNGLATLSLYIKEMGIGTEKIKNLKDQYAEFQEEVANGTSNLSDADITSKTDEYINKINDVIGANADLKKSIVDMVSNGLNAQKDALGNIIDKLKKASDNANNLYEYQKKLKDETASLASIQKQLASVSGDNSEEGRARKQKLETQLKDAQQSLQDTERDQSLQDQENMLSDLQDNFEDFITDSLKNTDGIVSDVEKAVSENPKLISDAINKTIDTNGIELSTDTKSIATGTSTISTIADNIKTSVNDLYTTATSIRDYLPSLVSGVKPSDTTPPPTNDTTPPPTNDTTPPPTVDNTAPNGNSSIQTSIPTDVVKMVLNGEMKPKISSWGHNDLDKYLMNKYNKYVPEDRIGVLANMLHVPLKFPYTNIVEALKKQGFSDGGIVGNPLSGVFKKNGDSLVATVQPGEEIFSTKKLSGWKDVLPPAYNTLLNMKTMASSIPSVNKVGQTVSQSNTFHIAVEGAGIKDVDSLNKALKDSIIQNTLVQSTVGQIATNKQNTLNI